MLRKNPVKDRLQQGEVVFGCMVLIPHPAVAEILGMAGFDFLMMDGEHGPLSEQLLENMVRACDSAGVVATARLPINDPQAMLPFLDSGILGAQLPHCNSAADAAKVVEAVKYAPVGNRGVTPGRVSCYGAVPTAQHVKQWNDEMLAIVQVEELEGAHNLPEILAVPGVDVLQIGLGDLASSMGYPGNADHPEVQEMVSKMVKRIRDAGLWAGVAPRTTDPAEVQRYKDMGVQIFKYGDTGLLRQRAVAVLDDVKASLR